MHIKEKFAMQLSNLLQNDKSFGELDEREENRKLRCSEKAHTQTESNYKLIFLYMLKILK
jgi:hypothetical protein